eukprot:1517494-Amphidinium_carterae.1
MSRNRNRFKRWNGNLRDIGTNSDPSLTVHGLVAKNQHANLAPEEMQRTVSPLPDKHLCPH